MGGSGSVIAGDSIDKGECREMFGDLYSPHLWKEYSQNGKMTKDQLNECYGAMTDAFLTHGETAF